MNDTKKAVQIFVADLKEYVDTRVDITSLTATEKSAGVLSTLITKGALILFLAFAIFFGSLGLAIYIGYSSGNLTSGFLWVAGGYAIIVIVLLIVKDSWLKTPILNALIKQFFTDGK
ncbi:MAG: hypothetical protein ACKVPJ_07780 [Chitinophagales bacterium]